MSTTNDRRLSSTPQTQAKTGIDGPLLMVRQVLHADVLDPSGGRLGRILDCICRFSDAGYPPVTGLRIEIGSRDMFVPMSMVTELRPGAARLQGQTLNLGRFERRAGEVLLAEDVLDRRMIDVAKGRLIVAENLALVHVQDQWRLAGVDPGRPGALGGLWRSLFSRRNAGVAEPLAPLVDWNDIEPFVGHVPTARLLMPLQGLKRLHPAQIADLVEHASHEEGEEIIAAMGTDAELTADVFEEMDPEHQVEFLRERSDQEAAAVLDDMELDDAADLLSDLPADRRASVLAALPAERQDKLRTLLQYHPEAAGGMMSPDVIVVPADATVARAIDAVRSAQDVPPSLGGNVFVTAEDGTLVGSVVAGDLLRAAPTDAVVDLEDLVKARISANADLQEVTLMMTDYNLTAVPVADEQEHLIGAISVDDVLEHLVPDDWRRRQESES
ncbi:MAG: CBS domain-containing protein [Candidatus Dormiibacterota bacterium]